MKKRILETSFLLLLLSCLAFQHIGMKMFVENVPLHSLEDKVENKKESKENLLCVDVIPSSFNLSSSTHFIVLPELFLSFNYKDKHFRPPIV